MDTQTLKFINGPLKYYFSHNGNGDSLNIVVKHCKKGFMWETNIIKPLFIAKLKLDGHDQKSREYEFSPHKIFCLFKKYQRDIICATNNSGSKIIFPINYDEKDELVITIRHTMNYGRKHYVSVIIALPRKELSVEDIMSHKIKKMKKNNKDTFAVMWVLMMIIILLIAFLITPLYLSK